MVWSNYQIFWLMALLLIGAVLPLVHGWYDTCPVTKDLVVEGKANLQNPSSYAQQSCTGDYKCCAVRGQRMIGVTIEVTCSTSCTEDQVDCSWAVNRCRNVADVIDYYKSSNFRICPFYSGAQPMSNPVVRATGLSTSDMLCPATDECSVARFFYSANNYVPLYYTIFICMNTCKNGKSEWEAVLGKNPYKRTVTDCTACSSTDDCKQKLDKAISHWTCPTTKGRRLDTKEAIEAVSSYKEDTCLGSDKCCADRSMVGRLTLDIKCSASCASPQLDCSQLCNCRNVADITRRATAYYRACLSLEKTFHVEERKGIPKLDNFTVILCPKKEKCSVGNFLEHRKQNYTVHRAFAGCMTDCKLNYKNVGNPNVCKVCSTTDDCRKILQEQLTLMPTALTDRKSAMP